MHRLHGGRGDPPRPGFAEGQKPSEGLEGECPRVAQCQTLDPEPGRVGRATRPSPRPGGGELALLSELYGRAKPIIDGAGSELTLCGAEGARTGKRCEGGQGLGETSCVAPRSRSGRGSG